MQQDASPISQEISYTRDHKLLSEFSRGGWCGDRPICEGLARWRFHVRSAHGEMGIMKLQTGRNGRLIRFDPEGCASLRRQQQRYPEIASAFHLNCVSLRPFDICRKHLISSFSLLEDKIMQCNALRFGVQYRGCASAERHETHWSTDVFQHHGQRQKLRLYRC